MGWKVYLSGEIHTAWRDLIRNEIEKFNLDVMFSQPNTSHSDSDDCGVLILGQEDKKFWHDHKGAKLNAMRNQKAIKEADIVVVRFGEKYKQWNAAFDAGYAAAIGKSLIVVHDSEQQHALKEIDAVANAVVESPEQVVRILKYVINGVL
mgnify:CR=1 FL=1